jgi:hypothetical protein
MWVYHKRNTFTITLFIFLYISSNWMKPQLFFKLGQSHEISFSIFFFEFFFFKIETKKKKCIPSITTTYNEWCSSSMKWKYVTLLINKQIKKIKEFYFLCIVFCLSARFCLEKWNFHQIKKKKWRNFFLLCT